MFQIILAFIIIQHCVLVWVGADYLEAVLIAGKIETVNEGDLVIFRFRSC